MAHLKLVDTSPMRHDDFVSSFDTTHQPEAASAVSEFGYDPQPQALTVSRWQRIKRAVRAWWVSRTYKP